MYQKLHQQNKINMFFNFLDTSTRLIITVCEYMYVSLYAYMRKHLKICMK
jgi:hypothetical protein